MLKTLHIYLYFVTCYTTSIYKYIICFKCKHTIEMNVIEDVLFMGVYCSFKINKSVVVFSLVWMTWMNVNPPSRSILAAHGLFRIKCRNIVYIWEEKCISMLTTSKLERTLVKGRTHGFKPWLLGSSGVWINLC